MNIIRKPHITYIYLALIITFIIGFFLFFQFTADDAFIMFRYSYNLIKHGIWNWNPNNNYAEAYTTGIYTFIAIIPHYLNIPPHLFFKLFGIVIVMFLSYRIYNVVSNKLQALMIVMVILLNWNTHIHLYSCLETIFWVYLLIELFISLTYFGNDWEKTENGVLLICLLLPLTRPEGSLFSVFVVFYIIFVKKVGVKYYKLIVLLIIACLYFYTRYSYFGELLPLPFYMKSVSSNIGLIGLLFNIYNAWQYLLIAIILFFILHKDEFLLKSFLLILLLIYLGLYGTSFLPMNFANRFSYQLFFPFIIYALIIASNNLSTLFLKSYKYAIVLVILLFLKGTLPLMKLPDINTIKDSVLLSSYQYRSYINIGSKLNKEHVGNVKILLGDAGYIPYLSQQMCYDYFGLCDPIIAKNKITNEYFKEINADLVIFGQIPGERKQSNLKKYSSIKLIQLLLDNNFTRTLSYTKATAQYEEISGSVIYKKNVFHFYFYVNKNSPQYTELKTAVQNMIAESEGFKFSFQKYITFNYLKL